MAHYRPLYPVYHSASPACAFNRVAGTKKMHAGRVAAAAALRCAIAACLAAFFGWMFLYPTGVQKRSLAVRNGLQISSLSGSTVLTLMLTCLSLLLATWATLLLRRTLSAHCAPVKRTSNGLLAKARSVLAWQVPPRAVLAGWCGGLSLAELAGILAWLLINAYWLGMLLQRSLPGRENWRDRLEKVAVAFGKMMAPNLMLLFLPVPHVSFITQLTGCSRNQLIRYHRWLGHGTIWVLNLHALLYYLYWGATSTFWQEIKAWDGKVNNLAGVIAWLFVLALWVSSLEPIRRRMYQVFFRFHIACFVGFFLFACAHYAACWTYFAPGLLLYGADLVLRSGQLANVTPVVAAVVDDAAGIATLQFESDTALTHKPLSEVWLLAPQVSRWQWHPFTVASGGGPHLTLHTKRYGRFTRSLLDGLRRRTVTSVRLTGPHGASSCSAGCQLSPPDSYSKYDSMVMIGGGVGVTALLSMLRHMVSQRASGQSHGLPSHVCCVWAARSPAEFASLDGPLLQAAAEAGWLELRLHLTASSAPICTQLTRLQQPRQQQPADMSPGGLQSVPSWARTSSDHSLKAGKGPEVGALLGAGDADVAVLAPPRACSASPYFWNLLRCGKTDAEGKPAVSRDDGPAKRQAGIALSTRPHAACIFCAAEC